MKMKCTICKENDVKYKCPRCEMTTCSLPCVKQHKIQNNCDGQRDKTAFVSVNDMTDLHLLNVFHFIVVTSLTENITKNTQGNYVRLRFLEDIGRKSDNASRDYRNKKRNRSHVVFRLQREARKRGVNLQVLPFPMSKRKNNTTFYNFKTKKFFWKVEWIFTECEVKLCDKRVPEEDNIEKILSKYIHPTESDLVMRQKLKKYIPHWPDGIRFFMQLSRKSVNCKRYRELSLQKSIAENLYGTTIVEHPTVFICTLESATHYLDSCEETKSVDKSLLPWLNSTEQTVETPDNGHDSQEENMELNQVADVDSVQQGTECENGHDVRYKNTKLNQVADVDSSQGNECEEGLDSRDANKQLEQLTDKNCSQQETKCEEGSGSRNENKEGHDLQN